MRLPRHIRISAEQGAGRVGACKMVLGSREVRFTLGRSYHSRCGLSPGRRRGLQGTEPSITPDSVATVKNQPRALAMHVEAAQEAHAEQRQRQRIIVDDNRIDVMLGDVADPHRAE